MPDPSASFLIRSSNTVLPTPRSPTIKRLFVGRPRRTRSMATRTVSRSSSRPASSGGGVPAPGAKGFVIGSIGYIIQKLGKLLIVYKLDNVTQTIWYRRRPADWHGVGSPSGWVRLASSATPAQEECTSCSRTGVSERRAACRPLRVLDHAWQGPAESGPMSGVAGLVKPANLAFGVDER